MWFTSKYFKESLYQQKKEQTRICLMAHITFSLTNRKESFCCSSEHPSCFSFIQVNVFCLINHTFLCFFCPFIKNLLNKSVCICEPFPFIEPHSPIFLFSFFTISGSTPKLNPQHHQILCYNQYSSGVHLDS